MTCKAIRPFSAMCPGALVRRRTYYKFLLPFSGNYSCILHHFRNAATYWPTITPHLYAFNVPVGLHGPVRIS